MTRLTEDMVALRTKTSNLSLVKKLNVWGSGISDISVVKKMMAVEVLALSVNNISNLEPVRDLPHLETLYLRKNQIKDPNELQHLQTLPNLKALWLDDNPFCEQLGSQYRQTILRMLPNLKRLDDKEVTDIEVEQALASGNRSNGASREEEDTYEDAYEAQQQQYYQQQQQQKERQHYQQQEKQQQQDRQYVQQEQEKQHAERRQSPQQQQPTQQQQQQQLYHRQQQQSQERVSSPTTPQQQSQQPRQRSASPQESTHPPSPRYDSTPQQNRMSFQQQNDRSPEHDSPQAGYQLCYRERGPIPPSMSSQSMKEYCQSDRTSYPVHLTHSQMDLSDWNDPYRLHREILERHGFRGNGLGCATRENGNWDGQPRPHCSYHRRLINRNSNLLSATLCLIKELDFSSLEVIEHAVRLRINELSTD